MLSLGHLSAMFWAGLRGGIALVLCSELGEWVDEEIEGARSTLRSATFVLVAVYLLFFGGTTSLVLRFFNIPMGEATSPDQLYRTSPHCVHHLFRWIHANVLYRVLVGGDCPKDAAMKWERWKRLDMQTVLRDGLKGDPYRSLQLANGDAEEEYGEDDGDGSDGGDEDEASDE